VSRERFGFLAPYLAEPEVEEIIVLGGRRTFVVRGGMKELLPEVAGPEQVRRIADQLLAGTGRRLDLADPIVSAQLPDGSRVHLTGPPVTHPDRLNIQVRKFVLRAASLDQLVELGALPGAAANLLREAVRADRTILVAGAPGAGKTTVVNCLLTEVPPERRVVTCEEVFEVQADLPDMTQMQTRPAGLDGGGAITLRDLVRESLRQRPDRIVVGEVRGPEGLLIEVHCGCFPPQQPARALRRRCRWEWCPGSPVPRRGVRGLVGRGARTLVASVRGWGWRGGCGRCGRAGLVLGAAGRG
jgi:pilus assembly protein CpaF